MAANDYVMMNGRRVKIGGPDDPRRALNYATLGPDGAAGPSQDELDRRRDEAIFNASAPRTAASIADFNKATTAAGDSFNEGNVARGLGQAARATVAGVATPFSFARDGASATADNLSASGRAISDFAKDVYNTTKGTISTAGSQLAEGFSGNGPALSSKSAAPTQAEIDAYAKSKGLTSKPPVPASAPSSPAATSASPAPAASPTSSRPSIADQIQPAATSSIPNAPQPYAPFSGGIADGLSTSSVTPNQAAQMAKNAPTIPTPTIGTAPEDRPTVRGIASFVQPPSSSASASSPAPAVDSLGRTQQQINMITNGTPGGIGTFSVIGGNEPSAAPRLPQFKELNGSTMSISEYNDAKAYNRNLATALGLQNQAQQIAIQGRSADARARIDMLSEQLKAAGLPSQIAEREAQAESNRANASKLAAQAPLAQRQAQLELAVLNGDANAAQTLKTRAESLTGSKDFELQRQSMFQNAYKDYAERQAKAGQFALPEQAYANSLPEQSRKAYGKDKVDYPKAAAPMIKELQDRYKAASDAKNSALKTELLRRWADTFGEDGSKYLSK